ncbi:MAG: hypothetical protein RBS73_09030 [Prolixibacteraceae bacterium]|jgi:hypothetical protein|nr:hypothetical protein [Prolixibacteraceae bacterium]
MKKLFPVFCLTVVVFVFQACNTKNRSKEIAQYETTESKVQLSPLLEKRVGSWIKEGINCYGIILVDNPAAGVFDGKEVKVRVIVIHSDKIKVKVLEEVRLVPRSGCDKIGISKGETWWEDEGDLFLAREAAAEYIKNLKSIRAGQKISKEAKFKVD